MDPNAALVEIRDVIRKIRDDRTARTLDAFLELENITTAAEALDEWLTKGGFLPAAWDVDTASSASRQHYIDTGQYLRRGEA